MKVNIGHLHKVVTYLELKSEKLQSNGACKPLKSMMFACYMYVQTVTLTPSPILRRCVMINSSFFYRPGSDVELFMSRTKYLELSIMKSSASELIRNACFNLECLNCLPSPSQAGISILDHLWNGFDSDAELFMCRTQIALIITTYFLSSLNENEYFSPFEFSSAGIKIGVQFSRSKLFGSALI